MAASNAPDAISTTPTSVRQTKRHGRRRAMATSANSSAKPPRMANAAPAMTNGASAGRVGCGTTGSYVYRGRQKNEERRKRQIGAPRPAETIFAGEPFRRGSQGRRQKAEGRRQKGKDLGLET